MEGGNRGKVWAGTRRTVKEMKAKQMLYGVQYRIPVT